MNRITTGILAAAFAASLGSIAMAATPTAAPAMSHSMSMKKSCPAGETYVKGHTSKKTGKHVKGYCRKAAAKTK